MPVDPGGCHPALLCIPWVTHFDVLVSLHPTRRLLAGLPATAIACMGKISSKRALISRRRLYRRQLLGASRAGWSAVCWLAGLVTGSTPSSVSGSSALALLPLVIWLPAAQRCFWVAVEAAPGQLRRAIQSHLAVPRWWGPISSAVSTSMVFLNQYSYLTFLLAKAPSPCRPSGSACACSDLPHRHRRLFTERAGAPSLKSTSSAGGNNLDGTQQPGPVAGSLVAIIGDCLSRAWLLPGPVPVPAPGSASTWSTTGRLASSLYLVGFYQEPSLGGLYLHPFWEQGALGSVLGIGLVLMITTGLEPLARSTGGRVACLCVDATGSGSRSTGPSSEPS